MLRVLGVVVPTWAAALTALVETFLVPLRVGAIHVPVALLLAVALNALIARWVIWAVRSRLAVVVPAAAWIVVVLMFSGGRAEGDVAIPADNWVGLLLMLVGPASFAVVVYASLLRAPRPVAQPDELPVEDELDELVEDEPVELVEDEPAELAEDQPADTEDEPVSLAKEPVSLVEEPVSLVKERAGSDQSA